jgi:hypothetical protein
MSVKQLLLVLKPIECFLHLAFRLKFLFVLLFSLLCISGSIYSEYRLWFLRNFFGPFGSHFPGISDNSPVFLVTRLYLEAAILLLHQLDLLLKHEDVLFLGFYL